MKTEELKKRMTKAFDYIAKIPAQGQAQELAVLAKNELRAAYQLLQEAEKDEETKKEKPNYGTGNADTPVQG